MISRILTLFLFLSFSGLYSQTFTDIALPAPVKKGGMPLMEALNERQSIRAFSDKEFTTQEISNLLWAAFGVNRTEKGKRTAPSAMDSQEIDIYVSLKSGVYAYDAKNNILKAVKSGDYREKMGKMNFVADAPLVLIYIVDFSKMSAKMTDESKHFYSATDVGYISQNVYLFAASESLATVVNGSLDQDTISKVIPLTKDQKVLLVQPVGFPK